MGVNYFADEQVEELRNNPYVKHVSNKAITYEDSFKEYFYFQYSSSHTRKNNFGRPKTKDLTDKEKLERAEQKIRILKQENDFLKRVRFINKKQISQASKTKPKNKN